MNIGNQKLKSINREDDQWIVTKMIDFLYILTKSYILNY
jgi:hypothetical protein